MKVRVLHRPIPYRPETPRCVARRVTRYLNDHRGSDFQCHHSSSFVVNGSHYCKRHAEIEVMKLTLKDKP